MKMSWAVRSFRHTQMAQYLERALTGDTSHTMPLSPVPSQSVIPQTRGKWKHVPSISLEDATEILNGHWESATSAEALEILKNFEGKIVRKLGKIWKIIRPEPKPPDITQRMTPKPLAKGVSIYPRRRNEGTCKKCGVRVMNTNRHNNPLHTIEACKLNIISRILND